MKKFKQVFAKIKPLVLPAVLVVITCALWGMREQIFELLSDANWLLIGIALVIAFIYLPVNASIWALVLQSLGLSTNRKTATLTWLRCESLRWLPGSIWGYASRAHEVKKFGGSLLLGGISLTFELIATILSWAIVAVIGLCANGFIFDLYSQVPQKIKNIAIITTLISLVLISVAVLSLRFFSPTLKKRLIRRISNLRKKLIHPNKLYRALFEYTCLNFVYSIGLYLCFIAISKSDTPGFLATAGANGLAWIGGVFSVGVPGGLGVREAITAMVFQPFGLIKEAAAAAILWRGLQLIVEMTILTSILLSRLKTRKSVENEAQTVS